MRASVVIPCFNEAERLNFAEVEKLLQADDVSVVLVDDGSSDNTLARLQELQAQHAGRIQVIALAENQGKAEAVRRGLLDALGADADFVGYLDADMATPPAEMLRLLEVLKEGVALEAVLGARVRLLGHDIARTPIRHYLGRIFATLASLVLDLPVYDTQCGAKVFRSTERLRGALALPFQTRWVFDVELLARLRDAGLPPEAFLEMPLRRWRDLGGSKLTPAAMGKALLDLLGLASRERHE